MLRRDSPTPREHMSERLWMRDRMALLHSVCHHHEFVKTSHRGSHETCSPQVLTEPRTSMAPVRTSVSTISSACSPLSGCEISNSSTSTPSFLAYPGSNACSASMKAHTPPAFCAWAMTWSAKVVLPELSGP